MGKETHIQWCDSSNNPQMGCEGCELVKGQTKPKCYAKVLTDRYAGLKGWPENFETPKIFMDRVPKMVQWPDLINTDRKDKPWLNGYPRLIFLKSFFTFLAKYPIPVIKITRKTTFGRYCIYSSGFIVAGSSSGTSYPFCFFPKTDTFT